MRTLTIILLVFVFACSGSASVVDAHQSSKATVLSSPVPHTAEKRIAFEDGSTTTGLDSPVCAPGAQVTTGVTFDAGTEILGATSRNSNFVVVSAMQTPKSDGAQIWYAVTVQNVGSAPARFDGDVAFRAPAQDSGI